jgi:hypothetical protein
MSSAVSFDPWDGNCIPLPDALDGVLEVSNAAEQTMPNSFAMDN